MAKRVQLIRHNAGSADAFTGRNGEITVDTTAKELRLHDSLTAGGNAIARKDLANVLAATVAIAGKMSAAQVVELTAATANIAQEILDRIADVDSEESRALAAEALLIPLAQRGTANGVATLNASGKVVQTAILADAATTLTGLLATIAELNIVDGSVGASGITAIAGDRVVYNDGGTIKQVALVTLSDYFRQVIEELTNKTLISPVINDPSFNNTEIVDFGGGGIVTSTAIPTTSGTEVILSSSIPSWVKKITIVLNGVKTSNNDGFELLVRDSSGYAGSTYACINSIFTSSGTASVYASTGLVLFPSRTTSILVKGNVTLVRDDANGDRWQFSFIGNEHNIFPRNSLSSGECGLSNSLTGIKILSMGGNPFSSGEIIMSYEG